MQNFRFGDILKLMKYETEMSLLKKKSFKAYAAKETGCSHCFDTVFNAETFVHFYKNLLQIIYFSGPEEFPLLSFLHYESTWSTYLHAQCLIKNDEITLLLSGYNEYK